MNRTYRPTDWTLCIVSLPSRDYHLRLLLTSLLQDISSGLAVIVLYNVPVDDAVRSSIERIGRDFLDVDFQTYVSGVYGIAEARNRLLRQVSTKYVAFVDDDCSFQDEGTFLALSKTLSNNPLGLVGLPSFASDTGQPFKPRKETPRIEEGELLYMPIEGMFAASFTQLLKDVGGFNERKQFFMEWTDLNTRMHRFGFPTAITMNSGSLMHWLDAPGSATRSRPDRSGHVTYGLLSTMIEFDWGFTSDSTVSPEIVDNVYYKYIYDHDTKYSDFLTDVANVLPRISSDMPAIIAYRDQLRALPFRFKPKVKLEKNDLKEMIDFSQSAIEKYRSE